MIIIIIIIIIISIIIIIIIIITPGGAGVPPSVAGSPIYLPWHSGGVPGLQGL